MKSFTHKYVLSLFKWMIISCKYKYFYHKKSFASKLLYLLTHSWRTDTLWWTPWSLVLNDYVWIMFLFSYVMTNDCIRAAAASTSGAYFIKSGHTGGKERLFAPVYWQLKSTNAAVRCWRGVICIDVVKPTQRALNPQLLFWHYKVNR